ALLSLPNRYGAESVRSWVSYFPVERTRAAERADSGSPRLESRSCGRATFLIVRLPERAYRATAGTARTDQGATANDAEGLPPLGVQRHPSRPHHEREAVCRESTRWAWRMTNTESAASPVRCMPCIAGGRTCRTGWIPRWATPPAERG